MLQKGNIGQKIQTHPETRGWFLGGFMPEWDFFHEKNVELKYWIHKKWEYRTGSSTNTSRKTLSILISWKVKVIFPSLGKEFILEKPFDYLADSELPGDHKLEVLEDSVILAIRILSEDA
jgi:hypothetical protein